MEVKFLSIYQSKFFMSMESYQAQQYFARIIVSAENIGQNRL